MICSDTLTAAPIVRGGSPLHGPPADNACTPTTVVVRPGGQITVDENDEQIGQRSGPFKKFTV